MIFNALFSSALGEKRTSSPAPFLAGVETAGEKDLTRRGVFLLFGALIALTFLFRIFYAGHLYEDDGLWFTSAEQILRGKVLYREIYFDKPPGLPLLYALLFKLFGVHILTIRLFTIVYAAAISAILYLFGSRMYGRRSGILAAFMFAVFSTTYLHGHMQGLNTDFLMVLPYTLGAYCFLRVANDLRSGNDCRRARLWLPSMAGAAVGFAFQINPKGLLDLLFFSIVPLVLWYAERRSGRAAVDTNRRSTTIGSGLRLFGPVAGGFIIALLPCLVYLAATHSLSAYREFVWEWGFLYAGYNSVWATLVSLLRYSAGYFAHNNLLLVGVIIVLVSTYRSIRSVGNRTGTAAGACAEGDGSKTFRADLLLLAWLLCSYAGLATGGRFYGHYFFQILPALCLLGARGIRLLLSILKSELDESGRWTGSVRGIVYAMLIAGFAVSIIRFHTRTAVLALDWVRSSKSESTRQWTHERLNQEERSAAAWVRDGVEFKGDISSLGLEAYRGTPDAAREVLFVWGYRPGVYFWAGLEPASRYLSTQQLTGIPADVHYAGVLGRSLLEPAVTSANRVDLIRELEARPPRFIVDELGGFNYRLAFKQYPEFAEFLRNYRDKGMTGRLIIYQRRDRLRPAEGK